MSATYNLSHNGARDSGVKPRKKPLILLSQGAKVWFSIAEVVVASVMYSSGILQ